MTITRAQIPEQIDVFNEGGEAISTTAQANDLSTLLSQFGTYEENLKKYQSRLEPFAYKPSRMNIYDLASELGAGLLSTPNTGGASAYTGLGVGFTRISDRLRTSKEENEKARQQIGLQAAQMAMQDEKVALEFIKEYELKNLDYRNKRGDLITFEYTDANGDVKQTTVRDNFANDDIIDDLITNKGAIEVKTPGSVVNVGGNQISKRDEVAIEKQYKSEDEILAKQRAGVSSLANLDEAIGIAERLGPENFGAVAKFTLFPRKLMSGLGITDENAESILGDQILVSQISLGFTMDIVSRTKGAISNREMEMFERASPGLGSNYNGFLKQAEYLKRIAQRDVDFFNAYTAEADRLEGLEEAGELRPTQVKRQLDKFEGDWYNENLIFNKEEFKELESIASGNYTDAAGNTYVIPEGFDTNEWRKKYREGQDAGSDQKSSYTLTKNNSIDSLNRKRQSIQVRSDLTEQEKNNLFALIDKQIKALQ